MIEDRSSPYCLHFEAAYGFKMLVFSLGSCHAHVFMGDKEVCIYDVDNPNEGNGDFRAFMQEMIKRCSEQSIALVVCYVTSKRLERILLKNGFKKREPKYQFPNEFYYEAIP
jgi:hypothetical protein